MRRYWIIPLLAGCFFPVPSAIAQTDKLTQAVTYELGRLCNSSAGYATCVSALRYHGMGQDDAALGVLLAGETYPAARGHYKIAQSKLKNFWTLVAVLDAPTVNCAGDPLNSVLSDHFDLDPKALADAADDSARNNFLALSDLLMLPAGAPVQWPISVRVYRFCFKQDPDKLFATKTTFSRSGAIIKCSSPTD